MTIQIEKNIPLKPIERGRSHSKYPFREMAVGDSFFVARKATLMRAYIDTMRLRHPDIFTSTFAVRTVEGGCRVWRTA